jgi:chromosome segregation ATPase
MTMLLLSQGRRDAGERALVGAIAGCGVGIGANTYVQGKRRQYAYREDRLQSMLTEVRRDNARVSRLIATSETVIAADKKRITEADRAYANKTISLAQARRELAAVTDNRNHLKQTHARLSRKLNDWERVSEQERRLGSDTTALDQEIHGLRKQISDLEEELLLIDQRIRVSPISA